MANDDHTKPMDIRVETIRELSLSVVRTVGEALQPIVSTAPISVGTARGNTLVLRDPTVSRFHAELSCAPNGGILVRDLRSTNGTEVDGVRFFDDTVIVGAGAELRLGESVLRVRDGERNALRGADQASPLLIGRSRVMRQLSSEIRRVAPMAASVHLRGESGTGKEVVARTIHSLSDRAAQPFVVLDCAAVTPALLASELFGHEKGAFTGADRRHHGVFERARGGTLFIDEIGELSREQQPALLGALERRRIRRVGGREEIDTDVRVISATHRDLRHGVNEGTFRLDLFYRLAVVDLTLPPLRERAEDLALLIEHFLREAGFDGASRELFDARELERLREHDWPGNLRELRNYVEATLVLGRPPSLTGDPDPAPVIIATATRDQETASHAISDVLNLPYRDARARVLERFERQFLTDALRRSGGNVRKAARDTQLDRTYLSTLIRKHGIEPAS